ncbi:MAG: sodium ion-translocating decarboxylase subunit beta, partial [Bacteroidales bacterium]
MKSIKKVLLLIFVFAFSIIFSPILNAKSVNSTENNQKSTTEQTVVTSENSANAVQDEGFDVKENLIKFAKDSGIYALFTTHWKALIMIVISCILLYLAIVKQYEPLLLLPIAFGMLLSNMPGGEMYHTELFADGKIHWANFFQTAGLIDYLYLGVKFGIYPCLIFIGIGAMTDFGPLIANPKSLMLGAAA